MKGDSLSFLGASVNRWWMDQRSLTRFELGSFVLFPLAPLLLVPTLYSLFRSRLFSR